MGILNIFKKKQVNSTKINSEDNLIISLKVMSILDIILEPEKSWLRYINYSMQDNVKIYNIDNGNGDTLKIFVLDDEILIKGFDHENELNQISKDEWDKNFFEYIYSGIPDSLKKLLTKEDINYTTFVMWYNTVSDSWDQNEIKENDGGKKYLLGFIKRNAEEWCDWAKYYYEKEFNFDVIKKIYDTHDVTIDQIKMINSEIDANVIVEKLKISNLL